jgi:hypothetical protein
MEFTKLVSVSKKSGLFAVAGQRNDGMILRSLEDDSTRFYSSRLHLFTPLESITVYTHDDRIIETYNFPGFWKENFPFYLEDCTGDGIPEFFTLTINKYDSIFISMLNFTLDENPVIHRYLTSVKKHHDNPDHEQAIINVLDNNGDGNPEVIACISAGYTIKPRRVYAWDIKNDSIYHSPFSGIKPYPDTFWEFRDLDGDGIREIMFHNVGVDNVDEEIPYPDSACWLAVLTKNLEYYRKPRYIYGPQSGAIFEVFRDSLGNNIILGIIKNTRSFTGTILNFYNEELEIIDSLHPGNKDLRLDFVRADERLLFMNPIDDNCSLFELDTLKRELHMLTRLPLPMPGPRAADINNDGKEEIISLQPGNNKSELVVLHSNYKDISRIELPSRSENYWELSTIKNTEDLHLLSLDIGQDEYILEYSRNAAYHLRLAIPVLIYILVTSLFAVFQKLIIRNTLRRRDAQDKLQTYQLQAVMNQLNPHFTFNAINSIGHAILTGQKEEAHSYFIKLSSLIRKTMYNALSPVKTLDDEISFVKEYLEIEEYRHAGKLSWKLEVGEDVDTGIEVPKMLIQIFTENSIKHGLLHKEEPGNIHIDIRSSGENQVGIEITDDGIGREKATSIVKSEGKGLKIFSDYINIYNQRYHNYIAYSLEDLYPHKDHKGTRVIIDIYVKNSGKKPG